MNDAALVARLRACNPPDRTIDEERPVAEIIHLAASRIEALVAARWKCSSCGAEFPSLGVADEGVTRCSKCVEVEALAAEVARLRGVVEQIETFAPADGTHGACLECGRVDVVLEIKGHEDRCALGFFIRRALASPQGETEPERRGDRSRPGSAAPRPTGDPGPTQAATEASLPLKDEHQKGIDFGLHLAAARLRSKGMEEAATVVDCLQLGNVTPEDMKWAIEEIKMLLARSAGGAPLEERKT